MNSKYIFLAAVTIMILTTPTAAILAAEGPFISAIEWNQLHQSYDEVPHRYVLKAKITGLPPLTYKWSVNCGYFTEQSNSDSVEWRYGIPGECESAVVTLVATDGNGISTKRVQEVFAIGNEVIEYATIQPAEPAAEGIKNLNKKEEENRGIEVKNQDVGINDAQVKNKEQAEGKKNFGVAVAAVIAVVGIAGAVVYLKKRQETDPSDSCEQMVKKLISEIEQDRSNYRTEVNSKRSDFDSLESRFKAVDGQKLINSWRNNFGAFWEAFSVVKELKYFGGRPMPEVPGVWDKLNDFMSGFLGEGAGAGITAVISGTAEEYAQVSVPLDTINAVGGLYDVFKKTLDPQTLGGNFVIAAGSDWDDEKVYRITKGLEDSVQTMEESLKAFNEAIEPFLKTYPQARQLLSDNEKCLKNLPEFRANSGLSGNCVARKAMLELELARAKKQVKECRDACGAGRLSASVSELENFKTRIESVISSMKASQKNLFKYRSALKKFFK